MRKMLRPPTSPGAILREEFLKPLRLTQKKFADHLGCDVKVINRIVNERCSVTTEVAVRLGAALGTSAEFWLNSQRAVDLYRVSRSLKVLPSAIRTVRTGPLH